MKTADKVLIGIVIGIGLLIIAALVVTLVKPEATYRAEDTPEGVAYNYLLALQMGEYERAYGYLYPTLDGYPASLTQFEMDIHSNSWKFRLNQEVTISVEEATINGRDASVAVYESRFQGGDLFNSGQSINAFDMELRRDVNFQWKIVYSPYYFARCWTDERGCK